MSVNPAFESALQLRLTPWPIRQAQGRPRKRSKAVVVTSAKKRIFMAGADLKCWPDWPMWASATRVSREGQELSAGWPASRSRWCAPSTARVPGGGLEVALACAWRVASDAKETVIGLPEVGVGLIPGWGRLLRAGALIGAPAAVDHILKRSWCRGRGPEGRPGDEAVPAAELKASPRRRR